MYSWRRQLPNDVNFRTWLFLLENLCFWTRLFLLDDFCFLVCFFLFFLRRAGGIIDKRILKETLSTSFNILFLKIFLCILIHPLPLFEYLSNKFRFPDPGILKPIFLIFDSGELSVNLSEFLVFLAHRAVVPS